MNKLTTLSLITIALYVTCSYLAKDFNPEYWTDWEMSIFVSGVISSIITIILNIKYKKQQYASTK